MIWLGNLFVGLVSAVLSYVGAHLAKKTVFALAAVAAALSLTAAFVFVIKGLLAGMSLVLPDWAVVGAAMFLPSNTALCISALISARVARWIYDYHMETLRLVSYIT